MTPRRFTHNARYAKLRRKVGEAYLNIVICFTCHAWNARPSPETRHIKTAQKIVEEVGICLFSIDFGIEECVDRPKRDSRKLDIVEGAFSRQQNARLRVYCLVDVPHNSAASIYRNIAIRQMFMVGSVFNSQKIAQFTTYTIGHDDFPPEERVAA